MSFELEKYEIDVQALMRGLVHELRNPLSAILTASNLLQGGELDEESQMLLEVVQKESRRMNRILTEFSHFAKPATARVEDFDLSMLAREVVDELKRDDVISLGTRIDDSLPAGLWAQGDPHHVGQAIRHILQNAAEASAGRGCISISGGAKGENVNLKISDEGKGLENGVMEKAFQPFFSTKPTATGLGLSIARMSLRASGGDATIANCPDKGACVRVILPAAIVAQTVVSGASGHHDEVVPARETLKAAV